MKIGLLGVGNIGATLARRLPTIGHDVKVANSRGPETIDPDVLSSGARAVTAAEAVRDVDVVILSIPLAKLTDIAELLADLPEQVVVLEHLELLPGPRRRDPGARERHAGERLGHRADRSPRRQGVERGRRRRLRRRGPA